MAADFTGVDSIVEIMRKSGRDSFAIMRPGQNLTQPAVYEYEGENAEDAAQQFSQWAALAPEDNTNRYDMNLYMKGMDYSENLTDKEKLSARSKKFRSKMCFTFQVHAATSFKQQPGNGVTVIEGPPKHRELPAQDMSKYMTRSEHEAVVNAAIEKVQTNHMIQTLSAEIAALSRRLEEADMEDFEDEDEDYEDEELEQVERVGEVVRNIIKEGKDAYLEIKGATDGKDIKGADLHKEVAGPGSEQDYIMSGAMNDELEMGEEASDLEEEAQKPQVNYDKSEYGKLPEYIKPPVHEDQAIKVNAGLNGLYGHDEHLGDDLLRILDMAKKKPNKFKALIISLRED
jgi:hypothetical protein